jgi:DNA-binding FrmR family transcriptional regulator
MKQLSDESKKNKESITKRLNRIEGQVKGIQKMVEEDRYCVDVLVQIAAIRSAIDKVGSIILENHVRGCVANSIKDNQEQTDVMVDELMDTILKFMK